MFKKIALYKILLARVGMIGTHLRVIIRHELGHLGSLIWVLIKIKMW